MSEPSSLNDDPDLPQDTAPRLGVPGTPEFFASILSFIRLTAPGVPLDPVIFRSIILSIMAGNRHVLLRTRDEDITIVQNLAALIFTDILGYTTHKHRITPPSDFSPSTFVSYIFSPHQGAPMGRLDPSSKTRAKRPSSHPNSQSHRRQASEPNASSSDTPASPTLPRERPGAKSRRSRRPPFLATATRSDSSGLIESESPLLEHALEDRPLPSALVLTGLEHAAVPCHRALLRTLLENRVTFGEDSEGGADASFGELPEDFIFVYVCPFDPRERPPIHKSLLDKFSLSVAVALHSNTREAHAEYFASHFGTQSSSFSFTSTQPATPNPILPRDFLPRLRSLSTPTHVNTHPSLRLYIADLIAAARHHHELDGKLLGVRCVQDAEALVRAHRVLGAGEVGSALVARAAALSITSAAGSTLSLHHGGGGEDISVHLHWVKGESSDMPSPRRAGSVASGTGSDWLHSDPLVKWDVSEVDVAKVVPRVISHRLRVRDGPEDEMMAGIMFMATRPRVPTGVEHKEGIWRRRTIKEIMVKLMAHV
ncbi:hypothetical protein BC827DRAFT_1203800 [Russula dissimulans]|nr:hypothetical protein BC827DRAFT_1203800 [Russula dissimulans]